MILPFAARHRGFHDKTALIQLQLHLHVHVERALFAGQVTYLGDWIESNDTDGFLVMHKGQVISEFYSPDMTPTSNHGLGSLTRNFVASSIAILAEQGRLSLDAPVQTYMPEMTQSGYAGATIQQLLDMRSGVASSMMQIMQATGWTISGSTAQSTPEGVHELLLTLPKEVDHGGAFKYRAGDTELLGCLCERVAGQTMGQVVSELIWQPIGAQQDADLMLDKQRTPLYSGGMSAALRDVAKFGALWLSDGASNGKQIIPSAFIHDTRHGSADAQNAFVNSAAPGNKHFFGLLASPGKMYKNQTWNLDETRGTVLMYGAAGQIIYTDPPAGLMCVVLSHWPGAFVPERVQGWLGALDALRAHLDLSTT